MSDLDNRAPKGRGGGGGRGGGYGGGGHGSRAGSGGGDNGDLGVPGWAIVLIFAAGIFAIAFVAVFWSNCEQELKRARTSETHPRFRLWRVLWDTFYIASGLFVVVGVALDCLDRSAEWQRKNAIEKMRAPTLRPEEASARDGGKHGEGRGDRAGGSVLAAACGTGNAGARAGGPGAGVGADAGAGGGASADGNGNGNGNGAPLPAATATEEITKPPPTAARGVAKPER
ncbi:hypothetical protein DL768_001100 [Monosporascus sp. mg162]|nr:hypothetical protein DL768_001100 [Monosporascus sp. mg162]